MDLLLFCRGGGYGGCSCKSNPLCFPDQGLARTFPSGAECDTPVLGALHDGGACARALVMRRVYGPSPGVGGVALGAFGLLVFGPHHVLIEQLFPATRRLPNRERTPSMIACSPWKEGSE